MNAIGRIGADTIAAWERLQYRLATAAAVARYAAQPRRWNAPMRNVFARQMLFTGIDAIGFVSLIAAMIGISVVVQVQMWTGRFGQSALLGPLLVTVVVRELAPLLTNFVIIGRSGTAMATEMGNMKINGEVRLLDAQGLDPFLYLLLPRATAMALSVFCLTVLFAFVALTGGYLVGALTGATQAAPLQFAETIVGSLSQADVWNLMLKTLLPGLLTGTICSIEGLGVVDTITEVPQATTRAVVRSTTSLFVISALVSIATYL